MVSSKLRSLLAFVILMGIAGAGIAYVDRPPLRSVSLLDLLPQATPGPLVGPQGNLGDEGCSPFLTRGWEPIDHTAARTAAHPAALEWTQALRTPVVVQLQACSPGGAQRVSLSLNGHAAQTFALGANYRPVRFEAGVDDVLEGKNQLIITPSKGPTSWRECQIAPVHAGGHAPGVLTEKAAPDEMFLYYGTARIIPLQLQPATELDIGRLDTGITRMSEAQLLVRLQVKDAQIDRTWHLKVRGGQHVPLKVRQSASALLTLMAVAPRDPGPGQLGVRLVRPFINSWSP